MQYALPLSILLLSACSHRQAFTVVVSPAFQPLIQEFERYSDEESKNTIVSGIAMYFFDLNNANTGELGECVESGELRTILIDPNAWNADSSFTDEQVFFHELGHCVLNRDHVTYYVTISGDSIPMSIMNPYVLSDDMYIKHRNYYMYELFNGPFAPGSIFEDQDMPDVSSSLLRLQP